MQDYGGKLTRYDEFSTDDEDLLLAKYYQGNFQYQSLLDSFNHFLDHDIKNCVDEEVINLHKGRIAKLEHLRTETPKITTDLALLEQKSYNGNIIVQLVIYDKNGKEVDRSDESILMKMPIMKYSKYSDEPLTDPQDKRLEKDPGCYFVIAGIIRIVLLYEKMRYSQYKLDRDVKTGEIFVQQINELRRGTSNGSTSNAKITMQTEFKKEPNRKGPIATTNFDKVEGFTTSTKMSVLEMAYVVYKFSDQEKTKEEIVALFEDYFLKILPESHKFGCWSAFQKTVEEFQRFTNLDSLSERMHKTVSGESLDEEVRIAEIERIIKNRFYPLHDEIDDKIKMLITMTARVLQCYTGKISITNKNHWAHKGLFCPGAILADLFRRKYSGTIENVRKDTTGALKDGNAQDIMNLIQKQKLDKKFMSDFMNIPPPKGKGQKGKGAGKQKRTGGEQELITQDLYPINTIDIRNALYRTRSTVDKQTPDTEVRALALSSFRNICSGFTDNESCGLIKFAAILTQITTDADPKPIIKTLLEKKFRDGKTVVSKKRRSELYTLPVMVNGLLIGYTNSRFGYKNIVFMKRYGIIDRKSCVVLNNAGCLEIYTDGHRLVRPTLVVGDNHRPRIYENKEWKSMSFWQLVKYGYLEYFDNYEGENKNIRFAQTFMSFTHQENDIRMLEKDIAGISASSDPIYFKNANSQLNSMKTQRYTHADFHPIVAASVTGALAEFHNYQQSCRTSFDQKMKTQDIIELLDNPHAHNERYTAAYGMNHILDSGVANLMGIKSNQGGYPIVIAFLSTNANQEDAAVISKSLIDFGLFRYYDTMIFREELTYSSQRFGRIASTTVHPKFTRHINPNGLPSIGAVLGPGDCVIAKYEEDGSDIIDKSVYLDKFEMGTVKEVVTYTNTKSAKTSYDDPMVTASVRLDFFATLEAGNKVSESSAQKQIVSQIWQDIDMPWTENGEFKIGMLLSPLSIPTRMTTGSLFELLASKAYAGTGRAYNAAAYRRHNVGQLLDLLRAHGFRSDGKHILRSGITGERLMLGGKAGEGLVFVGPSKVKMLAHIAKKKLQCRAIGNFSKTTRQGQPTKMGTANDKPQKFAEAERVAALKGEAKFIIQERTNVSADAYTVVVCRNCSAYASFDKNAREFTCKYCGIEKTHIPEKEKFGKYILPYTSRYAQELMRSIGHDMKIKFVSKEEYLKKGYSSEKSELEFVDLEGELSEEVSGEEEFGED